MEDFFVKAVSERTGSSDFCRVPQPISLQDATIAIWFDALSHALTFLPNLPPNATDCWSCCAAIGSCAVAFSGGLDSTLLAKAAQLALGDRAVAVTGQSASLAVGELDEAARTRPADRHPS